MPAINFKSPKVLVTILCLVLVGTLIAIIGVDAEKPIAEKPPVVETAEIIVMDVSGYTSEPGQTDSSPCIAADNSNICERKARGELICASWRFPLGSLVHVDGLGTCTVRDRMNRRYENANNLDWYFGKDAKNKRDKKKLALRIGRRDRKVEVIRLGKAKK